MTDSSEKRCGGTCACRTAPKVAEGNTLYVFSSTGHSLKALARAAGFSGIANNTRDGVLALQAANGIEELIPMIVATLSATELEEARAVVGPSILSAEVGFGLGMRATSLRSFCAQRQHKDIAALMQDESNFYSRYQPIVDLKSNTLYAYEALLRAKADGEEIAPGPLFEAAEAAGWTHVLDRIGRESAISNAGGWLSGETKLFINFIPTSIYRPEVCLKTTETAAKKADVSMDNIVFEVVESHQVADISHLKRVFDYYRSQGAHVALDDVGSGYSSLNMLAELEPDVVKIDMALIQSIDQAAPLSVVKAITAMAHDFGALVIAEGIETNDQLETVKELGIDLGQGYLLAKPQMVSDIVVSR